MTRSRNIGGAAMLVVLTAGLVMIGKVVGCQSSEGSRPAVKSTSTLMISGTATYRQRIALPPDAVLHVTLEDVSRADGPATLVAERRIATEGRQVPIPFSLEYDASTINHSNRYHVRARVLSGERVLFTTTDAQPVITHGAGTDVRLMLQQAGGEVASAPAAVIDALTQTPWRLVEINGHPSVASDMPRRAGITFLKDGGFASNTSINNMSGRYRLEGDRLTLEGGPMTMMAGPEPLMQQEQAFIAALKRVTGYRLENGGLSLVAGDEVVLRFERGG